MARQLHFYRLANTLRTELSLPLLPSDRRQDDSEIEAQVEQKVAEKLPLQLIDVTKDFSNCQSKMVVNGLEQSFTMLALPLFGLAGKIGTKTVDAEGAQLPRLGRELAGAAKLAGVKGVFHSDELPAYGIEDEHVESVRSSLNLSNSDGFVLCLAPKWQAELALESVLLRARAAWHRIPQEVRNVVIKKGAPDDGTTAPMRPLPGGARMYPETDIPSQKISSEKWQSILENLPMTDSQRMARMDEYDVSSDQKEQILARELDDTFVDYQNDLPAKAWAAVLLENDEVDPRISSLVLSAKEQGELTRESINDVIAYFADKNPELNQILAYAEEHGLKPADESQLADIISAVVADRIDFIKERGMGAIGPLMGVVMQQAGAADGKAVSALLKQAILDLTK